MVFRSAPLSLSPMDELALEEPLIELQRRQEDHCVACDPARGMSDPIEPPGGEAAMVDDADLF